MVTGLVTEQIDFVFSIVGDGTERDIWRLIRRPRDIRSFACHHPEAVHTWKDGQQQYTKLVDESRVGGWGQVQQWAKAGGRPGKHLVPGWLGRWEDAVSPWIAIESVTVTPENFNDFPERSTASPVERMRVPLQPGETVTIGHYLCAPEEEANLRAFVGKTALGNWFWVTRRWEPFSIVHAAAYSSRYD